MLKHYLLLISILFLSFSHAKDQNLTTFLLLKVNDHTITSNILPSKKLNAFKKKFNINKKKILLNQLVNDELAIQYAFKYMKLDDNNTDEKKRLNIGLTLINKIAIKESLKYITDNNVSTFYQSNKKDFWHEKQYSASHILLKDINLTKELINTLTKSSDVNQTFKELAEKNSKDISSKNGGYLGYFESKVMVKPFKDALENLKVNKFSDKPVKTKFGYHIIYLHKISEKGYVPLEKVKKLIKINLAKEKKSEWFNKVLSPFKEKAKVNYLFDINTTY